MIFFLRLSHKTTLCSVVASARTIDTRRKKNERGNNREKQNTISSGSDVVELDTAACISRNVLWTFLLRFVNDSTLLNKDNVSVFLAVDRSANKLSSRVHSRCTALSGNRGDVLIVAGEKEGWWSKPPPFLWKIFALRERSVVTRFLPRGNDHWRQTALVWRRSDIAEFGYSWASDGPRRCCEAGIK